MKKIKTTFFPRSFTLHYRVFFTALLHLCILLSPPAGGQTLDDFKEAAKADDGVKLIPYKDLRNQANPVAEDVQSCKNIANRIHFDVSEKQKKGLLDKIQEVNEEIAKLKKDAEKFGGEKFIDKRRMADLTKALSGHEDKLMILNREIRDHAVSFDNLYIARARLRIIFQMVLDRLPDTRSHPERILGKNPSAQQKEELLEYIKVIEKNIVAQKRSHKDQEDGARKTHEAFAALLTEPN